MSRLTTAFRALIAVLAIGAALLPATANAYWRGGVWIGVAPIVPYYPPPVYVAPPVVYAPPPVVYAPPTFSVTPPGFAGPGAAPGAPPGQTAAGPACYAGAYVCPLTNATPLGGPCSCPSNNGRVSGIVR